MKRPDFSSTTIFNGGTLYLRIPAWYAKMHGIGPHMAVDAKLEVRQ